MHSAEKIRNESNITLNYSHKKSHPFFLQARRAKMRTRRSFVVALEAAQYIALSD